MKRKFVGMTRKEWASIHYPEIVGDKYLCGVKNCPEDIQLDDYNGFCETQIISNSHCKECWNLPAKRNGRWILKEVTKQ